MKQSILIVGAGAVGQVYAYYFARAGHYKLLPQCRA